MKALKMEELDTLSAEELDLRENQLRGSLFKMRMKLAVGQLSKVTDVNATRKNLARVLTVKRQRATAAGSEE
ncbi:MAG: 50S ribosomal protein L29 [Deltaproteobacteria bacterium]|nr:50S ribosomal protein L29 [Deltaproteobacteria bacterium]